MRLVPRAARRPFSGCVKIWESATSDSCGSCTRAANARCSCCDSAGVCLRWRTDEGGEAVVKGKRRVRWRTSGRRESRAREATGKVERRKRPGGRRGLVEAMEESKRHATRGDRGGTDVGQEPERTKREERLRNNAAVASDSCWCQCTWKEAEAEDAMAGGRERRREREREEESERKDKKKKFAVLLSRLFLPLVVSPPSQHTLFVDNVLLCLLAPGSRVLLRLRRERALRREQSRCHAGRGLCSVTLFKKSDANGRQMYCGPIIILSLSLFLFQ